MLNPLCCETPRHCSVRHSTSSQITDVCFAAQRVSQVKTTFKPLQLLVSLMSSCWICIFPNCLVHFGPFFLFWGPVWKSKPDQMKVWGWPAFVFLQSEPTVKRNCIFLSAALFGKLFCHCTTISPYKFENASLNLLTLVCSNMDGTTAIYQSRFCKFR